MPPTPFATRYKLTRRVRGAGFVSPPPPFEWKPWAAELCDLHAAVKHLAFAGTPDTKLFPNLGSLTGCRYLMLAIRDADEFCPEATWLLAGPDGAVGCIQGLYDPSSQTGFIQNVGVVPAHQGKGLGSLLIRQCVAGFAAVGAAVVSLDVTAENATALRIYRRAGFRRVRVTFREYARAAGLVGP